MNEAVQGHNQGNCNVSGSTNFKNTEEKSQLNNKIKDYKGLFLGLMLGIAATFTVLTANQFNNDSHLINSQQIEIAADGKSYPPPASILTWYEEIIVFFS